jgi:hypothetical protein
MAEADLVGGSMIEGVGDVERLEKLTHGTSLASSKNFFDDRAVYLG